jgi:hypothetical protein
MVPNNLNASCYPHEGCILDIRTKPARVVLIGAGSGSIKHVNGTNLNPLNILNKSETIKCHNFGLFFGTVVNAFLKVREPKENLKLIGT